MLNDWILDVKNAHNTGAALSALVAESKKEAARKEIDAAFSERAPLYRALKAAEPKARKNAARLLGALSREGDADALAEALSAEDTRFVVPSILLALGSCGGAAAKAALEGYCVPIPKDESEEKHCAEIAEALRKARAQLCPREIKTVDRLPSPREILLKAPEGFESVLQAELTELGFDVTSDPCGARVVTDDFARLFLARCFTEALYPLGEGLAPEPEALAEVFSGELTAPYRVELRGYAGDRSAWIERFVAAARGENDPSHYALEARIELRNGAVNAFLRQCNIKDGRFSYRRQALPASMHPALAAAIVRYAAPFCKKDEPDVLDPCCGSGTFLIEREIYSPCASLFGLDLAPHAVAVAKMNALAAKSEARFIQKDLTKFTPRAPVDEIYANLPFGNRVGSHENNERLYAALSAALPTWLNAGGIAVLYTMEYRLLNECLKKTKGLVRKNALRTEAGGLLPWVFIVEKG